MARRQRRLRELDARCTICCNTNAFAGALAHGVRRGQLPSLLRHPRARRHEHGAHLVFRDTHEFLGRLLADGILQGLRIDHVDGLADPQRYCRRLNAFAAAIVPRDASGKRLRPYILVEKILTGTEKLPQSWPVSGTTGYDYLALANGLFIDPTGFAKLQRHWRRFTGGDGDTHRRRDLSLPPAGHRPPPRQRADLSRQLACRDRRGRLVHARFHAQAPARRIDRIVAAFRFIGPMSPTAAPATRIAA